MICLISFWRFYLKFSMASLINRLSIPHTMDLSRFRAAPSARLSYLSFESDGAFPAQC
jgi:hypothetical protein